MNRPPTPDEDDVAEDFEKDEVTLREIINVKVSDFLLRKSIWITVVDFWLKGYMVVVGGEWREGESDGACER